VDELPGSPHVFDGSTSTLLMFTACGSLTTMYFGVTLPVDVAFTSVSLPQPTPAESSIAPSGGHCGP
jgi:hypothetical protein